MKKIFTILALLCFSSASQAYRDSDIDNLNECMWNKKAVEEHNIDISCNDLYHLYSAQNVAKTKRRPASVKLGAFNILGDGRFKDYALTANIIKGFDLIAVSEMRHSTGREFESNMNLSSSDLNFKEYYHKPGYLKLLLELRKVNSSWSMVVSPVGQSENEELLGFYFRSDRVQIQNSEYCKSYNRKLREKKDLVFAGGYDGPKFKRKAISSHLNKSYACLLDIDKGENDLFRVPFSARFKIGTGFDFQMLSYHARFQSPIAIGGACGFECLEKVNSYLNTTFHKEGSFLKTLDYTALRFLKKHIEFLSLTKDSSYALHEEHGSVIKFKYSRPRVYNFLIEAKEVLKKNLSSSVDKVWSRSYKSEITKTDKDYILRNITKLFSSLEDHESFKDFIAEKGKIYKAFLKDVVNEGVFAETNKRYKIWTSPEKLARFNEVSLILNEMEKVSSLEKDKDVLLAGDLNLEDAKDTYYWNFFKGNYKYADVAIGSLTSISDTNGLKSAYDHFMYDGNDSVEECLPLEANVVDFINEKNYWKGFYDYFVQSKSEIDKLSKLQYEDISKLSYVNSKGVLVAAKDIKVSTGYTSCWDGEVHRPASLADTLKNTYECRMLNQYLEGPQDYRLFTELVSDHLPISMKCSKTADID